MLVMKIQVEFFGPPDPSTGTFTDTATSPLASTPSETQLLTPAPTPSTNTPSTTLPAVTENLDRSRRLTPQFEFFTGDQEDDWEDQEDDDDDDDEEEEDDGIPVDQPGVSTWHQRNPGKPVIPLRTGRKKQTAETRATAKLKRAVNKQKSLDFQADIDAINDARNKLAREVAEKHGVKVDLVLRRLMAKSSFKATRKVNLFNAKVHHLCKKAKRMGKAMGWAEAKKAALNDPAFQNLSKLEEWALRAGLLADREKASTGTRATNNAARADANFTIAMLAEEIVALAERTGMLGFAVFSRGHIHDKTMPTQIQSMGALDFCIEVLGISAQDLALKFELWCIARDKGLTGTDDLLSMRKVVNAAILTGLMAVLGKKKAKMNYRQYTKKIVIGKGVILKGWPLDGGVVNPTTISDVESMRSVRDALKSGVCYWHRMSTEERQEAKLEYEEMVESGEVEVVARKERSDKNTRRKGGKSKTASAPVETRSRAPGAKGRRVWEEDDTAEETEEERSTRRKEKEKSGGSRAKSGGSKSRSKAGEDAGRREKGKATKAGGERREKRKATEEGGERPRKRVKKTGAEEAAGGGSFRSLAVEEKRAKLLALAATVSARREEEGRKTKKKSKSKGSTLSKVPPGMRDEARRLDSDHYE
ncbi:hypothetical protein C8R46DRAFT_1214645 [Mycena filopes]|nr:hypothetical protein C8R46DRAFT_1214645 [Mycena filopes]